MQICSLGRQYCMKHSTTQVISCTEAQAGRGQHRYHWLCKELTHVMQDMTNHTCTWCELKPCCVTVWTRGQTDSYCFLVCFFLRLIQSDAIWFDQLLFLTLCPWAKSTVHVNLWGCWSNNKVCKGYSKYAEEVIKQFTWQQNALSMLKLVHCIHCSDSKQKLSVSSLCMTEGRDPFGECMDLLTWKDLARCCKVQSQEIG